MKAYKGLKRNDNGTLECYGSAIQMAEWKDEQFEAEKQVLIDKACEWWKNELTYPTMTQAEIDWYQDKIEAFKKYMEGQSNEIRKN